LSGVVLVVDDERSVREGLVRAMSAAGHLAIGVDGVAAAKARLAAGDIGCVLLDVRLKDGDGIEFLRELRQSHPRLPVIMATAYGDSARTITAMREGAFDYVTKPFDLDALGAAVDRALRTAREGRALEAATEATDASPEADPPLIGGSAPMLSVWKAIGRAAGSDVPVLITGESGVGKELVARAIHEAGANGKTRPFVAVNLAALPATLVESELFGHEKGAFTGASARREGRFEAAAGGTLFLDEIGDLEPALQTKLLRVLEDGTFERLGSQTQLRSDARIISATSKPVGPKAVGSTMREDLFYRLGVLQIEVPPLRARTSDIPLLVAATLRKIGGPRRRALTEPAMSAVLRHPWPGNVRELVHVLERACVMSASDVLDVADLGLPAGHAGPSSSPALAGSSEGSLDLRAAIATLEREYIGKALRRAGGNKAEAARLLGIARPQLYTKAKELGIDLDES
jgi:DNA-binding NtrC family response regulator